MKIKSKSQLIPNVLNDTIDDHFLVDVFLSGAKFSPTIMGDFNQEDLNIILKDIDDIITSTDSNTQSSTEYHSSQEREQIIVLENELRNIDVQPIVQLAQSEPTQPNPTQPMSFTDQSGDDISQLFDPRDDYLMESFDNSGTSFAQTTPPMGRPSQLTAEPNNSIGREPSVQIQPIASTSRIRSISDSYGITQTPIQMDTTSVQMTSTGVRSQIPYRGSNTDPIPVPLPHFPQVFEMPAIAGPSHAFPQWDSTSSGIQQFIPRQSRNRAVSEPNLSEHNYVQRSPYRHEAPQRGRPRNPGKERSKQPTPREKMQRLEEEANGQEMKNSELRFVHDDLVSQIQHIKWLLQTHGVSNEQLSRFDPHSSRLTPEANNSMGQPVSPMSSMAQEMSHFSIGSPVQQLVHSPNPMQNQIRAQPYHSSVQIQQSMSNISRVRSLSDCNAGTTQTQSQMDTTFGPIMPQTSSGVRPQMPYRGSNTDPIRFPSPQTLPHFTEAFEMQAIAGPSQAPGVPSDPNYSPDQLPPFDPQ